MKKKGALNSILLAVDGSASAEEAVRSVKAFTPANRIFLLHCISIPQLAYPGTGMSVGREFTEMAEQALRQEGHRILKKAAEWLPQDCGNVTQHLESGTPASVILSMAQRESVDLIIMGSRGLGAIQEHVLGGVSHRVSTHAPCPTLIVKAPMVPLSTILLPVAHPTDAEWAIEFLARNPFRLPPRVTILHVLPFAQPELPVGALLPDSWEKELQTGGTRFTKEVVDRMKDLSYPVEGFVERGAPSAVIQEHVKRLQPQMVLMGVHTRSLLQRLLQGSVSHATVHHTPCSVLLIKGEHENSET